VFYGHLEATHGLGGGGLTRADAAAGTEPGGNGGGDDGDDGGFGVGGGNGAWDRDRDGAGVRDGGGEIFVLCRWTDDLLHISSSRGPAEGFLSAALAGFAEYGCIVNTAKTSLNFDYTPSTNRAAAATPSTNHAAEATPSINGTATRAPRLPPHIPRREAVTGSGRSGRRCIAWCGLLIDRLYPKPHTQILNLRPWTPCPMPKTLNYRS
jgi:hypothetical protein